jgi:hypothetical protein
VPFFEALKAGVKTRGLSAFNPDWAPLSQHPGLRRARPDRVVCTRAYRDRELRRHRGNPQNRRGLAAPPHRRRLSREMWATIADRRGSISHFGYIGCGISVAR